MTGWCDEVEQSVHTVVPEAGVTLNTRFLRKNIIVLSLQISHDL